jgi:hypothetical protein
MLSLGSRRVALRLFKSWNQYQAESLGLSLTEYYEVKEQIKEGPFEEWKRQVATSSKIDFLLDHSSPQEQSTYLKEFDTLELAKYILKHIDDLPEQELHKIVDMPVRLHALPGFNELFQVGLAWKTAYIKTSPDKTDIQKLRALAVEMLNRKVKEIELRRVDNDISKVHTEVQAPLR